MEGASLPLAVVVERAQGMRVAIYARVSSDDQADRNFSILAQLEACRYYAQGKG